MSWGPLSWPWCWRCPQLSVEGVPETTSGLPHENALRQLFKIHTCSERRGVSNPVSRSGSSSRACLRPQHLLQVGTWSAASESLIGWQQQAAEQRASPRCLGVCVLWGEAL